MKKTNHYQLNLWDEEDFVLREDFNADNEKLDSALSALEEKTALSDSAAAALALAGSSATARGALDFLARYNLHWWRRRYLSSTIREVLTGETVETVMLGSHADGWKSIQYAADVTVSAGGILALSNPQKLTQHNAEADPSVLAGKFFTVNDGSIFFCAAGTALTLSYQTGEYDEGGQYTELVSCTAAARAVTAKITVYNFPWQYLQSAERDEYPHSGTVDGQEYQYLGVPFENAAAAAQVESGSYVGSGAGADRVIALPFAAKLVHVQQADNSEISGTFVAGAVSDYSLEGTTLTVPAATAARKGLNSADKTYLWVAVG